MIEIGRLCIKTAGRDAMRHCVIIDVIDNQYVLVDGNTRRKKVNVSHIEPLNTVVKVKKNATTKEVLSELETLNIPLKKSSKPKPKKEKKEQIKKTSSKKKSN